MTEEDKIDPEELTNDEVLLVLILERIRQTGVEFDPKRKKPRERRLHLNLVCMHDAIAAYFGLDTISAVSRQMVLTMIEAAREAAREGKAYREKQEQAKEADFKQQQSTKPKQQHEQRPTGGDIG